MEPQPPPVPTPTPRRGPPLPVLAVGAVLALVVLWPRLAPAPPSVPDERPVTLTATDVASTGPRSAVPPRRPAPVDPAVAAAREPAPGAGLEPQEDRPVPKRPKPRRRGPAKSRPPRAPTGAGPAVTSPPPRPVQTWTPPARRRHDAALLP